MSLPLNNESKNALSLSNESKETGEALTWDEADFTWDEGAFPWTAIGRPLTKEAKNTLSMNNEGKN